MLELIKYGELLLWKIVAFIEHSVNHCISLVRTFPILLFLLPVIQLSAHIDDEYIFLVSRLEIKYHSQNPMFKLALFVLLASAVSASYDPTFGQKLCRLTVASYCRKAEVQKWSCTPCKNSPIHLTNVLTFQNSTKDTLGYIGTSSEYDAIVLVFRGTLPWDIKNWISDINFVAVNYPLCNNLCKVHRGFYYAFMDIEKQVMSAVASYRAKYSYSNIIVTGHSLGAALATLATAHLMANKYKVNEFYNFGSPRVGDAKFTAWFNDLYGVSRFKARVTHHRDPVPHLPFQDWGFKHVNTEVFYKGKVSAGYVVCNDAQAEDKSCSDQYKLDTSTLDHVFYYGIDFTAIVLPCQV